MFSCRFITFYVLHRKMTITVFLFTLWQVLTGLEHFWTCNINVSQNNYMKGKWTAMTGI